MVAVQCCCRSRAKQANNRRTSKHASKLGSKQSVHFVACQHAQPNSDTLSRNGSVANVGGCRIPSHKKKEVHGLWLVAVAS